VFVDVIQTSTGDTNKSSLSRLFVEVATDKAALYTLDVTRVWGEGLRLVTPSLHPPWIDNRAACL